MSAYLGIAYPDRVEILTDGASTFDDGTLARTLPKVWSTPLVPFAVAGAGDLSQVENVALYLRGWAAGTGVEGALDALSGMPLPDGDLTILVAAVAEETGPGLWLYSTRDDPYGIGKGAIPAGTVTRWEGFAGMGSGIGAEGISALGLTSADFREGIREGGLKIMEAWRANPCVSPARPHLEAGYYVGGHVDYTVVSAGGVTVERVHEWPDVVGEKIRP